jgi:hypothetical protein
VFYSFDRRKVHFRQHCDVSFLLQDGSTVQAHKLLLAVTSPVFELEDGVAGGVVGRAGGRPQVPENPASRAYGQQDGRRPSRVKSVFMNAAVKTTSKLLCSEEWVTLDQATVLQVSDQEFLAATEGELYLGAKRWCLAGTATEPEALKLFLEKFVQKITLKYMSQRDFLTCVADNRPASSARGRASPKGDRRRGGGFKSDL